MNSDFLIIGCTSEIGAGLVRNLLDQGFKVDGIRFKTKCANVGENHNCVSADLFNSDLESLSSLFSPRKLILVSWYTEHGLFWDSTLNAKWFLIYKELCSHFASKGVKSVVGFGSCAEYSWGESVRLSESADTKPASLYGMGKLRLFNWLTEAFEESLWIRPFFVYGPSDHPNKLIKSAILSKERGSLIKLVNSRDLMDYIYIDDVISVSSALISKDASGVYNLGNGVPLTPLDVMRVVGGNFEVGVAPSTKPKFVVADNQKITKELGFINWTGLEAGVANMLNSENFSLDEIEGNYD